MCIIGRVLGAFLFEHRVAPIQLVVLHWVQKLHRGPPNPLRNLNGLVFARGHRPSLARTEFARGLVILRAIGGFVAAFLHDLRF